MIVLAAFCVTPYSAAAQSQDLQLNESLGHSGCVYQGLLIATLGFKKNCNISNFPCLKNTSVEVSDCSVLILPTLAFHFIFKTEAKQQIQNRYTTQTSLLSGRSLCVQVCTQAAGESRSEKVFSGDKSASKGCFLILLPHPPLLGKRARLQEQANPDLSTQGTAEPFPEPPGLARMVPGSCQGSPEAGTALGAQEGGAVLPGARVNPRESPK